MFGGDAGEVGGCTDGEAVLVVTADGSTDTVGLAASGAGAVGISAWAQPDSNTSNSSVENPTERFTHIDGRGNNAIVNEATRVRLSAYSG